MPTPPVEAVDPFWVAFVPQLLASLAGAAVGVIGVLIGFALQNGTARRDAADAAAENVLQRISDFVEATDRWSAFGTRAVITKFGDPPAGPPRPTTYAVTIALEILAMRTRGQEHKDAVAFRRAWTSVMKGETASARMNASGYLAGAISSWRVGGSAEDLVTDLATVVRVAAGKPADDGDDE